MAHELIDKYITCVPLASETTGTDPFFTQDNAREQRFPVQLEASASSDEKPIVSELKGHATDANVRPLFGKLVGMASDGSTVRIATAGQNMIFARGDTAAAVTNAEIGRGIRASTTTGTNGVVVSGDGLNARDALERGTIVGGNSSSGTTDAPAYYRVSMPL